MRITTIRAFALGTFRVNGQRQQRALDMEAEVESGDTYADVSAELQRHVDAELATWVDTFAKDGPSGALETRLPRHLAGQLFVINDHDEQLVTSIEAAIASHNEMKTLVASPLGGKDARRIFEEWRVKRWPLDSYKPPLGEFFYISEDLPF